MEEVAPQAAIKPRDLVDSPQTYTPSGRPLKRLICASRNRIYYDATHKPPPAPA